MPMLQKKPLIDFVYALSVSSNLVLSLEFAINSFLSRTILVSNLVPLRPSSYVRLSHISVGNFQLLSPRLRQCTLVFRRYYF